MNPALLALSRAYMALPGAPKQDHPGHVTATGQRLPDGRWRTPDGYLWVWDDETTQMVLDLTDAATGGVMLDRLGSAAWRVSRRHPAGNAPPWCADLYFSDRPHVAGVSPSVYCATLAEAVARAAVALGRAG